jgi:hypothetical protein
MKVMIRPWTSTKTALAPGAHHRPVVFAPLAPSALNTMSRKQVFMGRNEGLQLGLDLLLAFSEEFQVLGSFPAVLSMASATVRGMKRFPLLSKRRGRRRGRPCPGSKEGCPRV